MRLTTNCDKFITSLKLLNECEYGFSSLSRPLTGFGRESPVGELIIFLLLSTKTTIIKSLILHKTFQCSDPRFDFILLLTINRSKWQRTEANINPSPWPISVYQISLHHTNLILIQRSANCYLHYSPLIVSAICLQTSWQITESSIDVLLQPSILFYPETFFAWSAVLETTYCAVHD